MPSPSDRLPRPRESPARWAADPCPPGATGRSPTPRRDLVALRTIPGLLEPPAGPCGKRRRRRRVVVRAAPLGGPRASRRLQHLSHATGSLQRGSKARRWAGRAPGVLPPRGGSGVLPTAWVAALSAAGVNWGRLGAASARAETLTALTPAARAARAVAAPCRRLLCAAPPLAPHLLMHVCAPIPLALQEGDARAGTRPMAPAAAHPPRQPPAAGGVFKTAAAEVLRRTCRLMTTGEICRRVVCVWQSMRLHRKGTAAALQAPGGSAAAPAPGPPSTSPAPP